MAKSVQQDIRQSKYEKKKVLKHEDRIEVCEENLCREMRRKSKKLEGEEKID